MTRAGWIGALAAAAFAVVTAAVWARVEPVRDLDVIVHSWAITRRDTATVAIARVVTQLGSTFVAIPLVAVLGYLSLPRRPARVRLAASGILATVAAVGAMAGLAVNAGVNGVRPGSEDWMAAAGGPTYPSGHTTVATILAAAIAWAASTRLGRSELPVLVAALLIAVGVGWSRVWLGVHWPSDVLGGWLFGIAWSALAVAALAALRARYPDRLTALLPPEVPTGDR